MTMIAGMDPATRASRHTATARGEYYCAFWIARQCFALDVTFVAAVIPSPLIVPVPLTPPAVLGLCNWRGDPLPVVALSALLGLGRGQFQAGQSLLVLKSAALSAAAPIDRVEMVHPFGASRMTRLTDGSAGPMEDAILEWSAQRELRATLLDGERVCSALLELGLREGVRNEIES